MRLSILLLFAITAATTYASLVITVMDRVVEGVIDSSHLQRKPHPNPNPSVPKTKPRRPRIPRKPSRPGRIPKSTPRPRNLVGKNIKPFISYCLSSYNLDAASLEEVRVEVRKGLEVGLDALNGDGGVHDFELQPGAP
jgi:hypothetical protein